jgi:hypothetical protein
MGSTSPASRKYFYAPLRIVLWRKIGLFLFLMGRAILSGCPERAKNTTKTVATTRIWASCPTIFNIQLEPWPRIGRRPKHDVATWAVTDDCPRRVPVTEAEVDMFEAWFGDLFDELFGPCR